MRHPRLILLVVMLSMNLAAATVVGDSPSPLLLSCREENDLLRVLRDNNVDVRRVATPAEAIDAAPEGAGVMILADQYPQATIAMAPALFEKAARKKLRLYVEFPDALPGLEVGKPRAAPLERGVVVSNFFGPDLAPLRILGIGSLSLVPVKAAEKDFPLHLVASRVAGVDTAVYGLPKETSPLLFEHPRGNLLVAATGLSRFVTGRYAPSDAWRNVWAGVLKWLGVKGDFRALKWTPTVRTSHGPDEALPADVEMQAVRRGVEWYRRSGMLPHPSRLKTIEEHVKQRNYLMPAPAPDSPEGDGSLGVLEAIMSLIAPDGSQPQGISRRGDCNGESAMALALAGKATGDKKYLEFSGNVLDYWYFKSGSRDGPWGDPKHGAYGLIAWTLEAPANYGDDNARLMLGTLAAAAVLGEKRYDEPMMMCLLAQLRTTGQLGFRGDCLYLKQLGREGWRHYFERKNFVSYSPHMEAYLWACFLWAYQRTGYEMFYQRAETAIRMTMDRHTDGWRWTNGLTQERARLVLPLAWLVRVKDTPEHRRWLRTCVEGLVGLQQPCGAIREQLGLPGKGMFAPPRVNRHYGAGEAPLIQENSDTISDLLYSSNFALLGLHEAAAATGEPFYRNAEDKLARFLCRIQVRSEAHPEVDGGWFRGFDYRRGEYWASNSDAGWGVWCIESGWTQGWITAVLAMRQMNVSLWDYASRSGIDKYFEKHRREMLPDNVIAAAKNQQTQEPSKGDAQ